MLKRPWKTAPISAAVILLLALPAALGAIRSQSRPTEEKEDVQAMAIQPQTEQLHIITGEPQSLEPAPDIPSKPSVLPETPPPGTAAMETTPAEPPAPGFEPYGFIPLSADLQASIYAACAEHEIAYDLILAIIKTESEFDAAAIGDSGHAYGLMQIQPRWWDKLARELGLTGYRTDPAQNAGLGIAILSLLLAESGGDLDKALIAYNGGADYPAKVYANYAWISEQGGNYGNSEK